jgi:organic radical activating enzyme
VNTLIIIPTRQCNLRCSYCPTVKDGWPSLSTADALTAIDQFVERFGSGNIKLFGGEPLLEPELVRSVIDAADARPEIARVVLCTNGIGLDRQWLRELAMRKKVVIALSMDGRPDDHRRFRRSLPDVIDSYDHIVGLLPEVAEAARVVVTQVIPPATAAQAARNFEHLLSLGFWRFKFLPAFYVRWRDDQIAALRTSFREMAATVRDRWASGRATYIRNLFNWTPYPTFNSALTLDADGSYYAGDTGIIDLPDDVRASTRIGTLAAPPSKSKFDAAIGAVEQLVPALFGDDVWESTMRADAELTAFCESLYEPFVQWRKTRSTMSTSRMMEAG